MRWAVTLAVFLVASGCRPAEPNDAIVMRVMADEVSFPDCRVSLIEFNQADLSKVDNINPGNALVLEADFELSSECNDAWTDKLLENGFSTNPPHGCCYKGGIVGNSEAYVSAHRTSDTRRHVIVPISEPLASVPWYGDKS